MGKLVFEIQNLTKNFNESLILGVLQKEKKHGYELALEIEKKSEGLFKFNHGTLYPILHKLEKDDLIKGIWKQEGPKRKRKYYTVTAKGKKYFAAQTNEWKKFYDHFFDLLGE